MIRADEGPECVRYDQADEANRTGDRDGGADNERGGKHRDGRDAIGVHANRRGGIRTGGECIEVTCYQPQDQAAKKDPE